MKRNDYTSALVTCERAVSLFFGWGHPIAMHANILAQIEGNH